MKKNNRKYVSAVSVIVIVLFVFACASTKKEISSEPYGAGSSETESQKGTGEQAGMMKEESLKEEDLKIAAVREQTAKEQWEIEKTAFSNEDILFEFDSAVLTPQAQEVLRKKANWLKDRPRISVIIEGHCDNRGTNEYNLALGDRRAYSTKSFLVDLGIQESRLDTVSYGEERPLDPRNNDEAWAKNRRAHFVIE